MSVSLEFHRNRVAATLLLLPLLALHACGGDCDSGGAGNPTVTPTAIALPTATALPCELPPPYCGGDFPLNTEMPTTYGPAWADVSTGAADFLPCFGPYALCYYANCTVSADGTVSSCPCFEWFGPNFVLINGILNLDSYQATQSQCATNPDSCQQINGAPVCGDISSGTFAPGAARISTFSLYQPPGTMLGMKDCTDSPGPYAGCMTALCAGPTTENPDGTVSITCDCPIYDGPFQIGTSDVSCDDAPMVWSAAYMVGGQPPNPCDLVAGGCIPDAPTTECGCPLYTSETVLPPGSGVDCNTVCEEYSGCLRQDTSLQLGFTCDATLCTSTNHDLVFDACLGLQHCDLSEIFKAEQAAGCSCCASQLCGCSANTPTDEKVFALDAAQRAAGETPQCDLNGTLCGTPPSP